MNFEGPRVICTYHRVDVVDYHTFADPDERDPLTYAEQREWHQDD